ncbi:flagellar filament capping protein FliD [Caproicibacterium amylolyticum]|uniref:Filament cap protein n=1 Tax=Caproicibacterium amylolyticum TaxID=2766537 RepID=A0A7G9WEB1_9FIRM|nr:flagellar filament capping protein FliD [Caproicibacterium amylolyticum]QNO17023.1 flagellar filament capping protein FliD [Caproicibacterium amylolyticum]
MSDITSSSTYSVGNQSYSNKGLSSLVSGMDTDSMVKKLLSGTQSKIDKQQQSKQVLEWKQDMYRDVITSINKFQSTYFGSSAKTDFTNSDFFNSMVSTVTSGSDCVKITGSSPDASTGNMTVEVTALASAAKIAGSGNLSKNFVSGEIKATDLTKFEPRKVTFTVAKTSGTPENISIDLSGVSNTTDMVNRLNQSLNSKGVSVQLSTSGTLSFITDNKDTSVKVDNTSSTETGLSTLGLNSTSASTTSDTLNSQILYGSSTPDATVGNTFNITLNGVSKQITIDPTADTSGNITQDAVKKALAQSIASAYGGTVDDATHNVSGGYINLTFDGDSFKLSAKDEDGNDSNGIQTSSQFTVTGMKAANIGIAPGTSSRVDSFSTLKEIVTNGGTDGTAGDLYKFTINGQEFSFTGSDTLYTVMNAVNNSSAGVKMSYSSLSDTFQMEATSTGANYNISIQQTAGNLFTKLLGKRQETANGLSVYQNASEVKYYNDPTTNKWYSDSSKTTEVVIDQSTLNKVLTDTVAAGSSAGSDALGTTKIEGNTSLLSGTMSSASFKLNVNGKDYSFNVPTKTDGSTYSVSSIISTINEGLKTQFDSTGSVANISIDASTGNLLINNGSIVKFAQSTVATNKSDKVKSAQDTDLAYRLGFSVSGKTNIATASTTVDQLSETVQNALKAANGSITNNTVLYSPNSADTTVASLLHLDFDTNANRFIGTASNLSAQSTLFKSVNAAYLGTGAKASTTGADSVGTAGSDAQAKVNGTTITRSSNSFTIDGVSMELTKKTAAGSPATISTSRDSDTIVKSVKQFVDDYNTLVKALRDQTDSDATYRKYAPLTDAQKAEMKDSEITSWEKNAKTGLLRNDDDILSFLNDMRSALYTKPTNSNYAMYDIGIETEEYSSGSSSLGTLTFDETAFRKALSDDPQSVANLFTDKESGVASQLSSICDATAKVSLSSPGSLVQLAGVTTKSWSTKNNDIYNQIKDIDDKITDLKAKYEDERTRYWNKFNSMEAILSNYNSQSSWLTSQFSS